MTVTKINNHFIKWLTIQDLHTDSQEWILELDFLNDEYFFFIDCIKWYTLQLIDFQDYSVSKKIVETLSNSKKTNTELYKLVREHQNDLEVLVDESNELKEEIVYKEEHKALLFLLKNHSKEHKELKLNLFDILKKIKKIEKQKHIIDLE